MIEGKILHQNNDGSVLIGVYSNKLLEHNIQNWEFNRPPDMIRIPEIAEQLKKQNNVDGFIYLFKKDDKIYCYDGIHRMEALKMLKNEDKKYAVIVHYYLEYNEQKIKTKFSTLNKCVPVPELYTSAHKELYKRELIENVVKYVSTKYSNMFKASHNPRIPHENRDNFTDKIQKVIEYIKNKDYNQIVTLIEDFNLRMRELKKIKLSQKQLDKCVENNCFIFTIKNWDTQLIKYYKSL